MKKDKKTKERKYGYFSNLKFILKNQWEFRKSYVFSIIINAPMQTLLELTVAFLPKIVLDCIENNAAPSEMLLKVGLAGLLFILVTVLNKAELFYEDYMYSLTRTCFYKNKLNNKLIDMDYHNFVYNDTREKKEKAASAIRTWSNSVTDSIWQNKKLFSSIFGFSSFALIIAQCNILFIPILIGCYLISALGWFLLQKYNDSQKDARSKTEMKLNYVTFRSKDFSDAKDIRVYNMTGFLMNKLEKHLKELQHFISSKNTGHLINVLLEDFLKFGVSLGAYGYLVYLKLNTDMSLGDFTLYFGAITGFGNWVGQLVDTIAEVIECDHHINDFRNFLDLKDISNKEKGAELPKKEDGAIGIELKNVTFTYDKNEEPTINNLSLKINPGEKLAIVGVNGAGKSTLVKLICGLFYQESGEILINGISSKEYNRDEYYTLFSTVFQDVSLLPSSIETNITLETEEKTDKERFYNCLKLSGLSEKINELEQKEKTLLVKEVHEGATAFSGGELQKLLLARALYKNAPIIILDEPTAALDPIAENSMYLKYSELTKGKTSIYISHRLSSTRFCDRIILLDNAKIVEEGTHEELLLLSGKYAEMFETQSKYYKEEAVI